MKSCLHFLVIFCRWNSKTPRCKRILHIQKLSSLRNQFWKRTMFFVFSFFHFLCNLRISTGPLSVTKNEIFSNLHYDFFIIFSYSCFYFIIKCKFCNEILNMTYLNDYFGIIIQFHSFLIFNFGPFWNINVAFGRMPSYQGDRMIKRQLLLFMKKERGDRCVHSW